MRISLFPLGLFEFLKNDTSFDDSLCSIHFDILIELIFDANPNITFTYVHHDLICVRKVDEDGQLKTTQNLLCQTSFYYLTYVWQSQIFKMHVGISFYLPN